MSVQWLVSAALTIPFALVPVSSVIEVEISPAELFQDIGSVIVEGRIPQRNKHGRKYGYHYWPVINKTDRKCCTQQPKNDVSMSVQIVHSFITFELSEFKENSFT